MAETTEAPVVQNGHAEPAEGQPPAALPVPVKVRTVDDDIEDVFKKSGGLKYKAAGKEKSISSAAELKRILSRVDGTESAAQEALKAQAEAAGIKKQLASLKDMKPRERAKALAALVGDERLVREAGCEAYMSKPIQMMPFIDTVRKLTSPRSAPPPPRNAPPASRRAYR
mgnify:CR=1 FL=1